MEPGVPPQPPLAAQLHVSFVIIADELFEGASPLCLVIIEDKMESLRAKSRGSCAVRQ